MVILYMKPVLQALVLAERVYEDKSGKKIIAGTFNRLLIGKILTATVKAPDGSERVGVPGGLNPGCPTAYISLTDVVDGTEITLQIVDVSKNAVLFGTGFRINSNDRLATVEIVAPLPPMGVFVRGPGTYSLDVLWRDEILGSHRLLVTEAGATT
jgi:hypothetical protein